MRRVIVGVAGAILVAICLVASAGMALCDGAVADPRMDRNVTCTIGYARLHDVTAELRAKTGVSIECGESPADWHVRDVPVFVYAKDIPLGTLLRSVADAAHVQLVRKTSSTGKEPSYRLYRTSEFERQIDGDTDSRLKAGLDYARWSWDAMVAYGSSPDSVSAECPESSRLTPQLAKAVGKVLGALSPDDKEKALAAGQIRLRAKDFPQAGLIQGVCRLAWSQACQRDKMMASASMPGLDEACLIVNVYQAKAAGYTGFVIYVAYPSVTVRDDNSSTTFTPTWSCDLMSQAAALADVNALKLPPKPDYNPSKPMADPAVSANLKPIAGDDDWKSAMLQATASVKPPTTAADWKCADVLAAVAETAHLNIVCEDFRSHKVPDASGLKFDLASCTTAGDVLRRMGGYKWFADSASRLLVGWDQSWRFRQKSLVEQAVLEKLKAKLYGSGVDLDDYVKIAWLSIGQRDSWLDRTRDLGEIGSQFSDGESLWKLYDTLSPEQKRLARSEHGLPLSALDIKQVSEFLSSDLAKAEHGRVILSADGEPASDTRRREVFADPHALSTAVLTVRQKMREPGSPRSVVIVGQMKQCDEPWVIELKGTRSGNEFCVRTSIPLEFPIRHGENNSRGSEFSTGVVIESHIRRDK